MSETTLLPASQMAGQPDPFGRLWTPHRMAYINGAERPSSADQAECPFCAGPSRSDEDALIVARGQHCYAVLNLFPYNPGHLLICPYRHVADLTDLEQVEAVELTNFSQLALRALRAASGPQGFNLGINAGAVAGAGIAAHLHQHIVPRWAGDSNFFPIVAQTKAIPALLGDTREAIAAAWPGEGSEA